jgi:hypothetical protein
MKSRFMTRTALAGCLALIGGTITAGCRQDSGDGTPSILHVKGDAVRVRLVEALSGRPVANANVEIWSDNGLRCIQPPCPTNTKQWRGNTDAAGLVLVPTRVLQRSTTVRTPAGEGDLIGDAEPRDSGQWIAELFARDSTGKEGNPIKLLDGRSRKAIASRRAELQYQTADGQWDTVTATSNSLGYIFVPLEVVARAEDRAWVVVQGYRKTHVDFAWTRRKTLLGRL